MEEQFGSDNPFDGNSFQNRPYLSFADMDNDGDQDAFIADQNDNEISYFKNDGNAESPYFVEY